MTYGDRAAGCPDCSATFEDGKNFRAEQRLWMHQWHHGHGAVDTPHKGELAPHVHDLDRVLERIEVAPVTDPSAAQPVDDPDASEASPDRSPASAAEAAADPPPAEASDPSTDPPDDDEDVPTLPGSVSLADVDPGWDGDQPAAGDSAASSETSAPSGSEESGTATGRRVAPPDQAKIRAMIRPTVDAISDMMERRLVEKWGVEPITEEERAQVTEAWAAPLSIYWTEYVEYLPWVYASIATASVFGSRLLSAYDAKQQADQDGDGAVDQERGAADRDARQRDEVRRDVLQELQEG